ncbi:hypothetical protein ASF62_06055 [Leifsonia sp. Leaf325]|nr:hypothetical protein ASF62_06055 [Leifsonia sp. Leaf325]
MTLGLASFLLWIVPILGNAVSLGAVVLGTMALAHRTARRASAIIGIGGGMLTVFFALLMTVGVLAGAGASADAQDVQPAEQSSTPTPVAEPTDAPEKAAAPAAESTPSPSDVPLIDGSVNADDSVHITVMSVRSGVDSVNDGVAERGANGEFAVVEVKIENAGAKDMDVNYQDFLASVDGESVEASDASTVNGDTYTVTLKPGADAHAKLYFDVPVDSDLDGLAYTTGMFGDTLQIALSE